MDMRSTQRGDGIHEPSRWCSKVVQRADYETDVCVLSLLTRPRTTDFSTRRVYKMGGKAEGCANTHPFFAFVAPLLSVGAVNADLSVDTP